MLTSWRFILAMFYKTCLTICSFLLLMGVAAYGAGFGRCPNYPSMPKFNMSRILGQWYEVEHSFYLPEIASGCTTLEFQPLNREELSSFNNFKLEVAIKTINRLTGNPSFHTRFPEVIARLLPGSGKYQILYTDYDNFAILWSCGSLGSLGYVDQIWIFGRERDFPFEIRSKIYDALKQLGLGPDRLVLTKNKDCPKKL
uniref:Lipocalin/cytosolic fatty-acid binding domain-containing protein n=1 Tax=Glossina austeni TaxID=7395 RepID=A0A1A9V0S6_GLOAU